MCQHEGLYQLSGSSCNGWEGDFPCVEMEGFGLSSIFIESPNDFAVFIFVKYRMKSLEKEELLCKALATAK